tara:strand:+ start:4987 stop:5877 length:891 start_codon:yes stop_codon:yes gene_type:complete
MDEMTTTKERNKYMRLLHKEQEQRHEDKRQQRREEKRLKERQKAEKNKEHRYAILSRERDHMFNKAKADAAKLAQEELDEMHRIEEKENLEKDQSNDDRVIRSNMHNTLVDSFNEWGIWKFKNNFNKFENVYKNWWSSEKYNNIGFIDWLFLIYARQWGQEINENDSNNIKKLYTLATTLIDAYRHNIKNTADNFKLIYIYLVGNGIYKISDVDLNELHGLEYIEINNETNQLNTLLTKTPFGEILKRQGRSLKGGGKKRKKQTKRRRKKRGRKKRGRKKQTKRRRKKNKRKSRKR